MYKRKNMKEIHSVKEMMTIFKYIILIHPNELKTTEYNIYIYIYMYVLN